MFQKLAPLIILALFAIGAYFMVKGMHHATKLSDPKSAKKLKIVTPQ
ncbi:hypothetical protein MNB_SV-4-1351 [hydrothermal vent metagenome]|uniref:Uncharacterized protein n=1 Tax=hydrothermal vent metagenome TaxID=652676 RepID=A0A1W1E9B6_9ZZZZ